MKIGNREIKKRGSHDRHAVHQAYELSCELLIKLGGSQ